MWRGAGAIAAGWIVWILVASILDIGLRHVLTGYTRAEPVLAFTLPMKVSRLTLGAISSMVAGAVTRWVSPAQTWPAWAVGAILLAYFVPEHVGIGARLPLWYHLTFLLTLAPLVRLGAILLDAVRSATLRVAA